MKNKIIIYLICVIILLNISLAQEVNYGDHSIYDPSSPNYNLDIYSDPTSYQNSIFYYISDPTMWDLEMVDWSVQNAYSNEEVFSIPEFYSQDSFYANMGDFSYSYYLDYSLVQYDNPELDHSKINGGKYLQDLGCVDCSVVVGVDSGEGIISYSSKGISNQEGDFVSIPGPYPEGTSFSVYKDIIRVEVPENTMFLTIPENDNVVISTGDYVAHVNGYLLQGDVEINQGQMKVNKGDSLVIGDVMIGTNGHEVDEDIYLFFDGEEHDEYSSYISIDRQNGKVIVRSTPQNDFDLVFLSSGSYLNIPSEATIAFKEISGKLTIQNRDDEGLIPLVQMQADEGEHTNLVIMNSGVYITYENGEVDLLVLPITDDIESVPFTILFQDSEGNNILGTEGQREKGIFDKSRNFVIVPESLDPLEVECKDCVSDLNTNDVIYNSIQGQLLDLLGEGWNEVEMDEQNVAVLSSILNNFKDLPPDVMESVLRIRVVPDDEIEEACYGKNVGGCAYGYTRLIVIPESVAASIIRHEASHTLTFEIEDQANIDSKKDLKAYQLELQRKYGTPYAPYVVFSDGRFQRSPSLEYEANVNFEFDLPQEEEARLIQLYIEAEEAITTGFEDDWKMVAGDEYETDLGPPLEGLDLAVRWADGSTGPKKGCMRPYGCNNFHEDVATFVEPLEDEDYPDYQIYRDVTDPNSDFYKDLIGKPVVEPIVQSLEHSEPLTIMTPELAEEWASRYRMKLALLNKYNFVTDEEYRIILLGF